MAIVLNEYGGTVGVSDRLAPYQGTVGVSDRLADGQ